MDFRQFFQEIKGKSRGWKLFVNDKEIPEVESVELSSKFGVVRYGLTPQGYDAWCFAENGGGGTVLVPYFIDRTGFLYVGVVEQPRPLQADKPVLNLPRGFLDPGVNHFQNALKEGSEEIGLIEKNRVFPLKGEPGNPNNTFFFTNNVNEKGEKFGIRFFGVEFSRHEIIMDKGKLIFQQGVVTPITKDAEKIMGTQFVPWREALQMGCMITNAGVGRLLAHLYVRI